VRTQVQGELPRLVHFKPNRRAVLSYGHHFVKIYADDRAYERAVAGMLAANALPMRSARCEAAIPELRLTAQSFVEGVPPAGPVEAAPAAGAFLAMLHGTPNDTVRVTPPSHRLESATASASLLASIEPRLGPRLELLLRRLEETMPDEPLVLSHGDFHARQMLELDGDYGVIDFDACCHAPAALDMATYISSLVRGLDDLPAGMAALEVLSAAYGRQPAGVRWYLACVLLRRASIPFRVFRESWPEQVEDRVRCAETALGS
jgi:aminoglycoside phosphotransferase (APT) family kinase protein